MRKCPQLSQKLMKNVAMLFSQILLKVSTEQIEGIGIKIFLRKDQVRPQDISPRKRKIIVEKWCYFLGLYKTTNLIEKWIKPD